MNKEKLACILEIVSSLRDEQFDMSLVLSKDKTKGDAIGWFILKNDCELKLIEPVSDVGSHVPFIIYNGQKYVCYNAIKYFFDLAEDETYWLFNVQSYPKNRNRKELILRLHSFISYGRQSIPENMRWSEQNADISQ